VSMCPYASFMILSSAVSFEWCFRWAEWNLFKFSDSLICGQSRDARARFLSMIFDKEYQARFRPVACCVIDFHSSLHLDRSHELAWTEMAICRYNALVKRQICKSRNERRVHRRVLVKYGHRRSSRSPWRRLGRHRVQ